MRLALIIAPFLLLGVAAGADERDATGLLFANDDVLEIRLVAPFDLIARERPDDDDIPGRLYVENNSGEMHALEVGIRTRGKSRRRADICAFPPLRLNLRKSQLGNSVFEGQDKLKLVTHCRSRAYLYEQALLAEHLAYRILNLLTEYSFRVRLVSVNYANADGESGETQYAFFIEPEDRLAKRIGIPALSVPSTTASNLDPEHSNLTSVFQYMIGNTDFASTAGPPGENCCHNYSLFGGADESQYSIPYDFDRSGIVNAPYALPNSSLRLKSVKDRLYRGFCQNNSLLPDTLELFRAKRSAIESLIKGQPGLAASARRSILKYVEDFFRAVSKERSLNRRFIAKCR